MSTTTTSTPFWPSATASGPPGARRSGLTTWKNAPAGPVRKADVAIAKNYLNHEELLALNLIVSAYLDFAELQANSRRPMHMADWISKLDDFLKLSDRDVLTHAGKISHKAAEEHAHGEFAKFESERKRLEATQPTSDFDKAVEEIKKLDQPTPPKSDKSPADKPSKKASKRKKRTDD